MGQRRVPPHAGAARANFRDAGSRSASLRNYRATHARSAQVVPRAAEPGDSVGAGAHGRVAGRAPRHPCLFPKREQIPGGRPAVPYSLRADTATVTRASTIIIAPPAAA